LEAVVLHESLLIDSWEDTELYPDALLQAPSFFTFPSVTAVPQRGNPPGVNEGLLVFTAGLVGEALDRLDRGLRSGGVARQYELLVEQLGAGQTFSPLYEKERDLRHEIIHLFRTATDELPPALDNDEAGLEHILVLEDEIAKSLDGAPEDFRRCAMRPAMPPRAHSRIASPSSPDGSS
jgi:hypothetical protein